MRPTFILLAILLAFISSAHGQQNPQPQQPAAGAQNSTTSYTLPPDKLEKARTLYMLEGKLRIVGIVISFSALLGVLYLGIPARYRTWAEKVSRHRFLQAFIFVPLLLLTLALLDLPLDAYGHRISLQYGLSVQKWGSWFGDFFKAQLISLVILTLVLWLLNFFIRRSPRRWWLYSWLVAQPFIVLVFFLAPLILDPVFNKFEPLENNHAQLVTELEKVVQRGGLAIPPYRMFEMKASEKRTTLNAYVTGLGASKRVVVWDNTIKKLTTPEILFVFGHEMGHYVLNHIYYGLVVTSISLLIGLSLVYRFSGWMLRRFGSRWHIGDLTDWTAVPMLFVMFGVLGFFAEPLLNTISRNTEHQADIYGLEVTHGINPNSQEVAAHSFQMLGEVSLDYPYPSRWVVVWFYDHPSIQDRVHFAHEYDPWDRGQPTRYVH